MQKYNLMLNSVPDMFWKTIKHQIVDPEQDDNCKTVKLRLISQNRFSQVKQNKIETWRSMCLMRSMITILELM
jgi:hypothetical protein